MKEPKNMKEQISLEELKIIQMNILEAIQDFCEKTGIHYSLACGTFLRAIRHQGYIPWDDDIDIYLTRKDYEILVSRFPSEYKNVKVVSLERDNYWSRAYAQAFDCRTLIQEEVAANGSRGVYIDIYPVDNVPDSDSEWFAYNKKRRLLVHLSEFKYVRMNKERPFVKNIILLLGKFALLPFSSRTIAKWINRYAQKYNSKGFHRSFECVQGMLQKRPFKSSLMSDFVKTKFEDREFMIMRDFDAYLSNAYGDYLQLPPIDKQVSHHKFKAWWK